jgi:hypothetical protein
MIAAVPAELGYPILWVPFRLASRRALPTADSARRHASPVRRSGGAGDARLSRLSHTSRKHATVPQPSCCGAATAGFVIGHPKSYHALGSRIAADLGALQCVIVKVDEDLEGLILSASVNRVGGGRARLIGGPPRRRTR